MCATAERIRENKTFRFFQADSDDDILFSNFRMRVDREELLLFLFPDQYTLKLTPYEHKNVCILSNWTIRP